jgi:polygalacturonase
MPVFSGRPVHLIKLIMFMKLQILTALFFFLNVQAYAQDYNIRDFGAVSDTAKLSTVAINKAVTACYKNGGGRVIIPSGSFKSGTIILKSNVELHLERGAFLYASTHHRDLPQQQQPVYRSQKDPGGWFALIYAEGASNIGISGYGTIDGQGALQKPRPEMVQGGDLDGRPRNILFISCTDVSVKDVSMFNAGIWNQHYLNCEDVLVDHIKVYNHANRNNDGIDIDGCRRFVLSNSIIDSDDDAIVLKSTGTAGCSDVTITNCITSSFTNAIKCGTESTGGFKNILINNCIVKPSKSKVPPIFGRTNIGISGISLEIVDGGTMEGVTVSNMMIEATECPIFVRLGNRARKYIAGIATPAPGVMKDIHLSNITAYSAGNYTSSITGVPGARIQNITLDHIYLRNAGGVKTGDYLATAADVIEDEKGYPEPTVWRNLPSSGLFIRHVGNVVLSDVDISSKGADPRPVMIAEDIDQLICRELRFQGDWKGKVVLKDVKVLNKVSL